MNIFNEILSKGISTKYNQDKYIYYRGDVGDSFYFIKKGSVDLSIFNLNGEKIILTELSKDDYFGQIEIFSHGIRPVNAHVSAGTELLCLSSTTIKEFIQNNNQHALKIVEHLCRIIDLGVEKIEELVVLNAYQKVSKKLYDLSCAEKSLHLHVSQKKLSEFLALSERTTNITLHRLKEEGLIIIRRSRIEIVNPYKLRAAYENDLVSQRQILSQRPKSICAF